MKGAVDAEVREVVLVVVAVQAGFPLPCTLLSGGEWRQLQCGSPLQLGKCAEPFLALCKGPRIVVLMAAWLRLSSPVRILLVRDPAEVGWGVVGLLARCVLVVMAGTVTLPVVGQTGTVLLVALEQ